MTQQSIMRFITRNMLSAAIDAQADTFDSHAVERHIYQYEQVAFVRELHENVDAGTYPFTETCRQLGQQLLQMSDLIEKIGEVRSRTFSGEMRPCALWRRLRQP
jgi:hypothetical protein